MGLFDWLFGKKQNGAPAPRKQPKSGGGAGSWKNGDHVLASWMDGYFYPGHITQIQGDTCEIAYDDGDAAWVHQANVRRIDIKVGSQVFCRFHAGPMYLPGTVKQQNGEKIQVQYENGEKEWTTTRMVRVKRPLANTGGPPAEPRQGQAMPMGPAYPVGPMPGAGVPGVMTGTMTGIAPMMGPPPTPFIPDVGDPVTDSDWRVGDRVLGRWLDLFWYPATILAIGTKGYHILFDDSDQRVADDMAIMPIQVEEDEEIFIRAKNQPQRIYTPARVLAVRGEVLDVEHEDGTQETNQQLARARFWRCSVGIKELKFQESDRVWAKDVDGFTYPAQVLSIEDDKIIVHFLDGPERMLTPELIKPYELKLGDAVQCRWKGGQTYFPGKVTQIDKDRVHLDYDDGDKEWTTVRLVRLPPKEQMS